MPALNFLILRLIVGSLAGLVVASTIWLLATEVVRPGLDYFPTSAQDVGSYSEAEDRARMAAAIGIIRGDLWSMAAITEASRWLFWPENQRQTEVSPDDVERARMTARDAAVLSPHDARVWLILAGLQIRAGLSGKSTIENLKLSYYTGPNEFALSPLRLLVAVGVSWDDELRGMVQSEILRIVLERPDLKPIIATAFRAAIPSVRRNLEAILKDADPVLLATIKAQSQPK